MKRMITGPGRADFLLIIVEVLTAASFWSYVPYVNVL